MNTIVETVEIVGEPGWHGFARLTVQREISHVPEAGVPAVNTWIEPVRTRWRFQPGRFGRRVLVRQVLEGARIDFILPQAGLPLPDQDDEVVLHREPLVVRAQSQRHEERRVLEETLGDYLHAYYAATATGGPLPDPEPLRKAYEALTAGRGSVEPL